MTNHDSKRDLTMASKKKAALRGKQMPVSTLLPPELVREVKRLCGITHAPMAAYVREGLELVLKKHAEKLKAGQ